MAYRLPYVPTFRRNLLPSSSGNTNYLPSYTLNMEATGLSETLVHIYQTTRHHIPDDSYFHSQCREDLSNYVIFEDTARICGIYDVPNGQILRFSATYYFCSVPADLGKEKVISSVTSKRESTIEDSQKSAT